MRYLSSISLPIIGSIGQPVGGRGTPHDVHCGSAWVRLCLQAGQKAAVINALKVPSATRWRKDPDPNPPVR